MSRGSRYRLTTPISIAWPTSRPEKYEKNLSRSIPASDSVRTHSASTSSVIMFSTLNSPATWPTGFVMYTTTTRTSWRKTVRRNSYRLVPAKIASAYSGLMDNSAVVGLGELKDRDELVFSDRLEATRGAVDVADAAMLDELLHIGSFRE